jgi:hypothetical protein
VVIGKHAQGSGFDPQHHKEKEREREATGGFKK